MKVNKKLLGFGLAALLNLAYIPMPMDINGQNPVIKKDGNDGYLYVGYDFNGDGELDRIDAHFYLGDQTIPYHHFTLGKDSSRFTRFGIASEDYQN